MSKPIHKQAIFNDSLIESLEKRVKALEDALKSKAKPKVNKGDK